MDADPRRPTLSPPRPPRPDPYDRLEVKIGAAIYVCVFMFIGALLVAAGLLWLSA